MKNRIVMSLTIVAAFVLVAFSGQALCQDWPMFQHDLALSGYSASQAPDEDSVLWIYDTQSPISSSPAIVNGVLYIGGLDGNLYAVDADAGSLMWTYGTAGAIYSSPAVASGNVYFLSTDGVVHALDAVTGVLAWSTGGLGGPWSWSSPAVHDGRVFIGASNGWVHSLDAGTGAIIWSTSVGGSPNGPIAVVNGKVYSGTHNMDNGAPTLVALDEATGGTMWTYNYYLYHGGVVGMLNSNGVAVVDGNDDGLLEVYFGVHNWNGVDSQAVCLDERDGTEIWTAGINGNTTSSPAVHDGRVFIGSDDGQIYALDAGTGAYVWSYQTGNAVWAAPAVADGKVFVGSLDHTLYALSEVDGSLVWSYYTGASRMLASPAVADGNVFVGNENGKIYAFGRELVLVDLDIKPGSCPNPLNVRAPKDYSWTEADESSVMAKAPPGGIQQVKAVLPVAILGTADFDVADIDPTTVMLEGVPALRWNIEDVSTPVGEEAEECECNTLGPDGYPDLTLKFNKCLIVGALGEVYNGDTVSLTMTGELSDGAAIEGTDCVVIRAERDSDDGGGLFGASPSVTLLGNYPNPFNPTTEISFSLPSASRVKLEVFNVMGQKVATLVDGRFEAGEHVVQWDGSNVASGVYFYRLQADDFVDTKKMVLLK